jgi:hypothetical protein
MFESLDEQEMNDGEGHEGHEAGDGDGDEAGDGDKVGQER